MAKNYIKYRVVYAGPKYLCANRKLTIDINKARVFRMADEAFAFAPHDIALGRAQVYAYGRGRSRSVISWG